MDNGGVVWKIISTPAVVNSRFKDGSPQEEYYAKCVRKDGRIITPTKQSLSRTKPRFTEIKDKYWDHMYGDEYCKTLTFVGFTKSLNRIYLPDKNVLPLYMEWTSEIDYMVDGKILPHPRDWAAVAATLLSSEEKHDNDDNDDDTIEFISLARFALGQLTTFEPNPLKTCRDNNNSKEEIKTRTMSFETPPPSPSVLTLTDDSETNSINKKGRNY